MSKAFDRMEWIFMENMLLTLGFHQNWIRNVMYCVRSVQYEIKYNDKVTDIFKPERGLRQGEIKYNDNLMLLGFP